MNRSSSSPATRRIAAFAGHTLLLLGLALPAARAQQTPAKDLMPLKATLTNRFQSTPIPRSPPTVSQAVTGTGESDLLGSFAVVAHRTVQLGIDGQFLWSSAEGVFTAANGDALYWSTNGIAGQPAAFFVTGGRGRFRGAVGSGAIPRIVVDPATGDATLTWVGTLSVPK